MDNLFAIETPLVERLLTQLPALRLVRALRDPSELPSQPPLSPAVYVLHNGHQAIAQTQNAQIIDQQWLIITVMRTLRDNPNTPSERTETGQLLAQICSTLIGWRPLTGCGPMTLANTKAATFNNGFGSYPLAFTTRLVLSGSGS